MAPRQVAASWAVIGKRPGTSGDYGVLAASDEHVGAYAVHYPVGVPDSSLGPDAPHGAPWVTFGSHEDDNGRTMLSVSVLDYWTGRDRARRSIWPRRFFLCDWEDLAAARVSYRTLYEAVRDVDPRELGTRPVLLRPEPGSPDNVMAAIEGVGFEHAATMAAALLDGPVAVTGARTLPLWSADAKDRLGVLDAVAALLPYPLRAGLSASTAVDNTGVHRVHLMLADFAADGQQAAPLGGAQARLDSEEAKYYRRLLADQWHNNDHTGFVEYAWHVDTPCSFEVPEQTIEVIRQFNWIDSRVRLLREGPEGLPTSLDVLAGLTLDQVASFWRYPSLSQELKSKELRPLLSSDHALVRQHWELWRDDVLLLLQWVLQDAEESVETSREVLGVLPSGGDVAAFWHFLGRNGVPELRVKLLRPLLAGDPALVRQYWELWRDDAFLLLQRVLQDAKESMRTSRTVMRGLDPDDVVAFWHFLGRNGVPELRVKLLRPVLAGDPALVRQYWELWRDDVLLLLLQRLEEAPEGVQASREILGALASISDVAAFWHLLVRSGLPELRVKLLRPVLAGDPALVRQFWELWRDDVLLLLLQGLEEAPEGVQASREILGALPSSGDVAAFWHFLSPDPDPDPELELKLELKFKLLRPLLATEDELVSEHWDLWRGDIITLLNRDLDLGHTGLAGRGLAIASRLPGQEDLLLMMLVVPPRDPDPGWKLSPDVRPRLLREFVPPEVGSFTSTCNVLRGSQEWGRQTVRDLLYGLTATDADAECATRWASWLCLSAVDVPLPSWGEALRYTIDGGGDGSGGEALRSLVKEDEGWRTIAFALAAGTVRAPAVLAVRDVPGHVLRWAVHAVMAPGADEARQQNMEGRRRILQRLVGMPLRASLGGVALVSVDVARVLLGLEWLDFPHDGHDFQDYMEGFRRVRDSKLLEGRRATMMLGYLQLLVGKPPQLTRGALLFLQSLPADELLADYVANKPVTDKLVGYGLGQEFWQPLAEICPALESTLAIPLLTDAITHTLTGWPNGIRRSWVLDKAGQRGLSSTRLALSMYDALKVGLTEVQILRVIHTTQVKGKTLADVVPPKNLDDMLREVQNLLHHFPIETTAHLPTGAEDILFKLEDLICGGALGRPYGDLFWQRLLDRLKAEGDTRGLRYQRLRRWNSRLRWRRPAAARVAREQAALVQEGAGAPPEPPHFQASGPAAGPQHRAIGAAVTTSSAEVTVPANGDAQQTQPPQPPRGGRWRHRRGDAQGDTTATGQSTTGSGIRKR